jgi:hypothetical protein
MAATGFTPVSLYYSATASNVPLAANLVAGELAMNTNDGKLFFKDSSGVVQTMASKGTGSIGGSTTQVQFNNAGVLGGSASLTWSGTVLTSSGFAGPLNGTVGATTPAAGSFTTTTIGTSETLSYGTANGVTYLNGSKVVTSGSALTFDGTNFATTGSGTLKNLLLSGGTLPAAGNPSIALRSSDNVIYHQSGSANNIVLLDSAQNTMQSISATANIFNISNLEQMRLNSTGLGIGTSSPAARLDLLGTASGASNNFRLTSFSFQNAFMLLNMPNNGTYTSFEFQEAGSTQGSLRRYGSAYGSGLNSAIQLANGSNTLTFDSSGNLGLGVTPSAWQSAFDALQFGDYAGIGSNREMTLFANAYQNSAGNGIYQVSSLGASKYDQYNGAHQWYSAGSGTAGNAITFTTAMTLDASGNLLVGTTSLRTTGYTTGNSQYAMETTGYGGAQWFTNRVDDEGTYVVLGKSRGTTVNSNTVVANADTLGAIIWQGTTGSGVASAAQIRAKVDGATISASSMPGRLEFYTTPSGSTTLAERMRIDSSGNVGIGTNSPTKKLDVYSTTQRGQIAMSGSNVVAIRWNTTDPNAGERNWEIVNNVDAQGTLSFRAGTSQGGDPTTTRMVIDSSGNVGIGTSSPRAKFEVNGIGSFGDGTAAAPTITFGNELTVGLFRANNATLGFSTGGSERMRIDSSGNLLVGTTSSTVSGQGTNGIVVSRSGAGLFTLNNTNNTHQAWQHLIYDSGLGAAGAYSIGQIVNGSTGGLAGGPFTPILNMAIPSAASNTAKVTIDSSGNLCVGRSSVGVGDRFVVQTISSGTIMLGYNSSATNTFQILDSGNVRNTNNSYGAISDAKMKENVVDATPKLEKLNQVRVVNFNLIGDEQKQIGVIAQELEQIFPSMVEESPDRDVDGNDLGTVTKSVKYSVFVPMLIKAMQEQQALIQDLTTRLAALEAK